MLKGVLGLRPRLTSCAASQRGAPQFHCLALLSGGKGP